MRRLVIVIITLALLAGCFGVGYILYKNSNSDEIRLDKVEKQIKDMENKVNNLFSNEFENTVISYLYGDKHNPIPIYKYVGPNNKFVDVCNQLKDYCTDNVAEMLIRKNSFINVDGNIGFIAATGEVRFSEFDDTNMILESLDGDKAVIRITRFTVGGDYSQDYLYTFQIDENGKYILIDLKETE